MSWLKTNYNPDPVIYIMTRKLKLTKRNIQTAQTTNQIPKSSNYKELEAMWKSIQKREKELTNKRSLQAKRQREVITNFLRNHQINPQTGYIESKWKQKTHYVSCGSKVIK